MCVKVPFGDQTPEEDVEYPGVQDVESNPVWVMQTKFGSSGRAVSALNYCAISPVPILNFKSSK